MSATLIQKKISFDGKSVTILYRDDPPERLNVPPLSSFSKPKETLSMKIQKLKNASNPAETTSKELTLSTKLHILKYVSPEGKKQCRICGEMRDDTIEIFGYQGTKLELRKKVEAFLPIQVRSDDSLPLDMCGVCRASLKQSQALFEICLRADKMLCNTSGKTSSITTGNFHRNVQQQQTFERPPPERFLAPQKINFVPEEDDDISYEQFEDEDLYVLSPESSFVDPLYPDNKSPDVICLDDSQTISPEPPSVLVSVLKTGNTPHEPPRFSESILKTGNRPHEPPRFLESVLQTDNRPHETPNVLDSVLKTGSRPHETPNVLDSVLKTGTQPESLLALEHNYPKPINPFSSEVIYLKSKDSTSIGYDVSYTEISYPKIIDKEDSSDSESIPDTTPKPFKFPQKCKKCSVKLRTGRIAIEHCLKFHKKHICIYCGHSYSNPENLQKHQQQLHTQKCKKCDANIFGSKKEMLQHINNEHDEIFNCNICEVTTRSKYSLNQHYVNAHSKFTCFVCMRVFENKTQLFDHSIAMKHGFACQHCKQFFSMKKSIQFHMKQKHNRRFKSLTEDDNKTKHHCSICKMSYMKFRFLKAHYTHFHGVFLCHVCREVFKTHEEIDDHCLKSHGFPSEWRFKCKDCGKYFDERWNLKSHIKYVHSGVLNLCELCGTSFKRQLHLRNHLRIKHGIDNEDNPTKSPSETILFCDFCEAQYTKKYKLTTHIKHHLEIKDVVCNLCDKTFYDTLGLKTHTQAHHEKIFQCATCEKLFTTQKALLSHTDVFHVNDYIYTCNTCAHFFKSKQDLCEHYKTWHDTEEISESLFTVTSPHQCFECGIFFPNKTNLKKHSNGHNSKRVVKKRNIVYSLNCEFCSEKFPLSSALNRHLIKDHNIPRPFQCTLCDRSYNQNEQLVSHVKKFHNSSRQFPCDVCLRPFKTRINMTTHRRKVHFADRNEICPHCNSGFKDKGALTKHLKLHVQNLTLEFECHTCRSRFSNKFALRHHMKRHERNLHVRGRSRKVFPVFDVSHPELAGTEQLWNS